MLEEQTAMLEEALAGWQVAEEKAKEFSKQLEEALAQVKNK
jgi:exonuclease VII small subunit